jgi:hypothetical protein
VSNGTSLHNGTLTRRREARYRIQETGDSARSLCAPQSAVAG